MSLTRTLYRSRILQRMDATGSSKWDSTAGTGGEIDPILSAVFDREWRGLLQANPYLRVRSNTPTSDSSGRYALSDLQSTSGDSQERLYRVLSVKINGVVFQESNLKDHINAVGDNPTRYVWWRQGDYLNTLPNTASQAADAIWVNHLPTRPDALSADSATVIFPDGYDEIVILEAAAALADKGGQEVEAARQFRALAEVMRKDMKDDLCRTGTRPRVMGYADSAADWGGA